MSGGIAASRPGRLVRRTLNRLGYDITHEPATYRLVRLLTANAVTSVIDVGANTGQYARELREARFLGDILSVEPLPDAFQLLERRAATDSRWRALFAAAGEHPGQLTIHIAGNSASSSVLPMLPRHADADPATRYVGEVEVEAVTIDSLIEQFELEPEHTLLKIDVQGFEHAVLRGASHSLPRMGAVQLELSTVPLYEGQLLLPQMCELLQDAGFELAYVIPGWVEPTSGRMLQVDGVFLPAGTRH